MTEHQSGGLLPRVAFIGLGNMGAPMSVRLAAAGYPVTGFDLSAEARSRLTEAGGTAATTAAEAVRGASIVILMLPNSAVVEAVLAEPELKAALAPGTTIIDMSSSEPLRTARLAAALAPLGLTLVDAPVSGGVKGAENGTLTIMVGSNEATLENIEPLLAHLGTARRAGDVGSGHVIKAINNLLSATHLLATAEGVLAGARFGLDPALMVELINTSSGRSGSTDNKYPNFVLPETFDSGFGLRLMLKDMKIATDLARELGVSAPLGEQAVALWEQAAEDLSPTADHTEIAKWASWDHHRAGDRLKPSISTAEQQRIKDEVVAVHGTWDESWESILQLRPGFLASYAKFAGVPWKKNHLDAKTKELIYLAVDAAATHLHAPGVRQHIRAALAHGATPAEIMEVIELTSTLGIHAMNIGVPLLVEVLEEAGLREGPEPLTEYQEELKARFTKNRGYWHPFWDEMLELDPEIFEAYTDFSSLPWETGTLEPKVKEFIYIAFDAAATHLYVKGWKLHMKNAIGYGASKEEILEVMEIASVMGMQAATTAFPILAEELNRTDRSSEEGSGAPGLVRYEPAAQANK